ncbi:MAG: CHAT domain-containing protein [Acidobacteriota bacterium]
MSRSSCATPWQHGSRNARTVLPCAAALALALLTLTACKPDREPLDPVEVADPREPLASKVPRALAAGAVIEQQALRPGGARVFTLTLAANTFLEVEVFQHESDLVLELLSPESALLVSTDRPIGHTGPEKLAWLADRSGSHRLRLRAPSNACSDGGFDLRVLALRPATANDRRHAAAFQQLLAADAARRTLPRDAQDRSAAMPAVIARFERVREAWQALDEPARVAEVEHRIASLHRTDGELDRAGDHFRAAVEAARQAQSPFWEMLGHHGLAVVLTNLDRLHEAETAYQKMLKLADEQRNRYRRAQAHRSLSQIAQRQGRLQTALDRASESLAYWRGCEARDRARAHHNLAVLYAGSLGRTSKALASFKRAAHAFERLDDPRNRAAVLNQWGQALHDFSRQQSSDDQRRRTLERARAKLEEALRLRQAIALPCRQAGVHSKLALLAQDQSELERTREPAAANRRFKAAAGHAHAAQWLLETSTCPRDEPAIRIALGDYHLARQRVAGRVGSDSAAELRRAEAEYQASFDLYEQRRDPTRMAAALTGLAKVSWAETTGDPAAVQQVIAVGQQGIELVESVRASVIRSDLRTSFFAVAQELYGLTLRALVAAGDPHQALVLAEQARARTLRDRLRESGAEIRRHAPPALLQREVELRDELGARIGRQRRRLNRGQPPDPRLDAAIDSAEDELAALHGEMRRSHPRHAELMRPRAVSLARIQQQLDPDTLLLETRLGDEASFLWAVTHDSLRVFELPPRARIEAQAAVAQAWLATPRPANPEALCPLSLSVLGPAAQQLAGQRLVLVLDGALERLPFAALPIPRHDTAACQAKPLVADHEVVYLPSAAALIELRDKPEAPAPSDQLAVVADPVYEADDPRLDGRAQFDPGALDNGWKRIPETRQEAEWLRRLVDPDRTWLAQGFEATKVNVTSGRLRDYRLIHFATHGLVDPEQPARSHLALSSFDRDGRELDGTLYAYEIYNLELATELVTLSACSTGAGNTIPGEGLVSGLARGFLYAGADRVLVSLWDVHDGRTSELMERFYGGLLGQGLPPAQALQEAQAAMWRQGRPPFEWSGFVLQGDWRPLTAVDPSPDEI